MLIGKAAGIDHHYRDGADERLIPDSRLPIPDEGSGF